MASFKPRSTILRVFLQRGYGHYRTVELTGNGLNFKIRGAMDVWTIKETFIDRFYEKYGTILRDGWSIIDIGGGIGDFSLFAASGFPNNKIYTFEPTPDSYSLMLENIHLNRTSSIKTYPYAVWSSTGELKIDTDQAEPGQFTSRPISNSHFAEHGLVVPCLSLEDVFEQTSIKQCDLLKIDSEGAEYPILFSAPERILKRIERMVLEYHDNYDKHTHKDLERHLKGFGFTVQSYPSYVHSHLGYMFASRYDA